MSEFRLLSKNFVLACAATFLFFGSFYLMLPVLPQFVLSLGGNGGQIGLVVGFLTMASVLVRPFFGRLSDRLGRKRVMLIGSGLFTLFFVGYLLVHSIEPLYLLRIAHGVGHAAMLAAIFPFVADLAPKDRRGEVMGVHGVSNVVAMALLPAAGVWLVPLIGFDGLFLLSLGVSALACLCVFFMDDVRQSAMPKKPMRMAEVFVLPPLVVAACTYLGAAILYGAVITFLPVYGPQNNVANVGLFFTVYAVFTFVSRLAAGRLSDRHGRAVVIIPSLALTALGGFVLVILDGPWLLAVAGACFGLGFGGFVPALNAFVVDNTSLAARSTALAIYTSFMDVGMTIGSILFGLIGALIGFSGMFLAASCLACCSVILFAAFQKKVRLE